MGEEKKKIIFIVNPISGTHNKNQILTLINKIIDKARYEWEIWYTEYAGHAVELAARAAAESIHMVVAIGGDGTINEIGRSLIHTNTALGIIPSGSGNGLARHLRISLDPKKALRVINDGLIKSIDYGIINDICFFCTCGVGFDAFISLKFATAGKRGVLTYLEKTLQEGLTYQPETYEIETHDGVYEYKAFVVACANASQYGNNAYIAPKASLTDGMLDVTIIEPFTVLEIPTMAFQLFNKKINQNSHYKTFRCKKLTIKRQKPGVMHFDGDPIEGDTSVTVEVKHKGLRVVVPSEHEAVDSANPVRQIAQDYIREIKEINESIAGNIHNTNQKFIQKISRKL